MLWTLCTCEWLSLNNLDADFMAQLGTRQCGDTVRVKSVFNKDRSNTSGALFD